MSITNEESTTQVNFRVDKKEKEEWLKAARFDPKIKGGLIGEWIRTACREKLERDSKKRKR